MLTSKPSGFSNHVTSSTDKNHPPSKSACLDLDMQTEQDAAVTVIKSSASQAKLCSTDCIMPSYSSQAFRESTALPVRPVHGVNVKCHVENNRNAMKQTWACSNQLQTNVMFMHPSDLWCKSIQTCNLGCKLKALTLRGLHVCKRGFSYDTDQCISTDGLWVFSNKPGWLVLTPCTPLFIWRVTS